MLVFESDQVLERVKKFGDLFEPVLKLKQKLPLLKALQQLQGGAEGKAISHKGRADIALRPSYGGARAQAPQVTSGAQRRATRKTGVGKRRTSLTAS